MIVEKYIRILKEYKKHRDFGKARILKKIGDDLYLAEYKGLKCIAILTPLSNQRACGGLNND